MRLQDHKLRVERLLRGDRHVADLDRLFADLRLMKPGRASVQEIGHFAAHREERSSGISLLRAKDIQTSAKLWYSQIQNGPPRIEDIKKAGVANFKIMPEEQIQQRFGIPRQAVERAFSKALKKIQQRRPLKAREMQILRCFGLSMMWQNAFSDATLFLDLSELLIEEGALVDAARTEFENISDFISLYALSIMHGSRLKLAHGDLVQLRLAASNWGTLRIVAHIPIAELPKPVTGSVSLFETSLPSTLCCDQRILNVLDDPIPVETDGCRLILLA